MRYFQPFGVSDPTAGWVNANPSAGIAGSIPDCRAIEQTQREIVNTIAAAGLTPNELDQTQLMQAVRGGALSYVGDAGTANTLLVNPAPAYINYFVGMTLTVKPAYGNTGPSTINVNSLSPIPIVKKGGTALSGGEWSQGDIIELKYNGTAFQLVGGGSTSGGANLQLQTFRTVGAFTYTVPAGVSAILVGEWGGGGSGGGVGGGSASGAGGGGGGYVQDILKVVPGQVFTGFIGAGGARTAAGAYNGNPGGTSAFGTALLSATGGLGGAGVSSGYGIGKTAGGMGYGSSSGFNFAGGQGRSGFASGSTYFGGDGGSSWCSGEIPFVNGGYHDGEMPGQGGAGAGGASGALGGGAGSNGFCFVQAVG